MTARQTPASPYVLVAEDDAAMRDVLVAALQALPSTVIAVSDGRALLSTLLAAKASGHLPALVVSDVHMPKASGLAVLAQIRRRGIAVDFVVLTALGDDEAVSRAKALGALAVFEKPFDLAELCALVRVPTSGPG